jgi:hypothetical protein
VELCRLLENIESICSSVGTCVKMAFLISDDKVVDFITEALRRQERSLAQDVVRQMLVHEQAAVRASAALVAGRLKLTTVLTELVRLLGTDHDEVVRVACCRALGLMGSDAAVEPLGRVLSKRPWLGLVGGESERVRAAAAWALARFPHSQLARTLLEQARKDKSQLVRTAVHMGTRMWDLEALREKESSQGTAEEAPTDESDRESTDEKSQDMEEHDGD